MGSKSERDALVLHGGGHDDVVRVPGENPFEPGSMNHLAGRTVDAEGEIDQQYFSVTRWSVVSGT
ncbi:hypothetical protein ACIQOV_05230 [Kitasatospora sp. NPDC091257]|uniref:hypothetical protein n=1 Tax=Kitasatospora sp. NPDC091257 TaxID=3364084 RepID=UPI003829AA44